MYFYLKRSIAKETVTTIGQANLGASYDIYVTRRLIFGLTKLLVWFFTMWQQKVLESFMTNQSYCERWSHSGHIVKQSQWKVKKTLC